MDKRAVPHPLQTYMECYLDGLELLAFGLGMLAVHYADYQRYVRGDR